MSNKIELKNTRNCKDYDLEVFMRKFSASLLAILFLLLSLLGCQSTGEQVNINTVFEAIATIKTENITTQAKIVCASVDDVSITLLSPESLNGLNYHLVNSTLYIDYKGLKCTTTDDYFTSYNPFEIIFDAVRCAGLAQYKGATEDGKMLIYTGDSLHGAIELYVDEKSGNIMKINPSYTNCEIELSYK